MKKKINFNEINKIAIIQTAFLGDTALTIPLAKEIRRINSSLNLTFITSPRGFGVIKNSIYIDNLMIFDKYGKDKGYRGMINLAKKLRKLDIDTIIAPHRSFRTSMIVALSKIKNRIGYTNASLGFVYNYRIPYYFHLHEVDRILSLLNAFDLYHFQPDSVPLISEFNDDIIDINFVERFVSEIDSPIIAVAPGSVWKTKEYPAEHYEKIILKLKSLNFKLILLGSAQEYSLCQRIAEQTDSINSAGVFSIEQLLIFLKKCKMVVTNDNAITHLAGLVDCSVLTIFGPTAPEFGFYPYNKHNGFYIQLEGLACKPCRIHGSNKCPIGTHTCMKELSPELVFNKVLSILNFISEKAV